MEPSNINKCNTSKLLETPKTKQYCLIERKSIEEGSVMASLILSDNLLKLNKVVDKDEVLCEIYVIHCSGNSKKYIGKAVSHKLNLGKYKRHGSEGRFRDHISEAFSKKRKQCFALNSAIKKYGIKSFSVERLCICKIEYSNEIESFFIKKYNTIAPNGYNLTTGGDGGFNCIETKKKIAKSVQALQVDSKIKKFEGVEIPDEYEKYIHPIRRNKIQYGWYFKYQNKKVDFGGIHEDLESSKRRLYDFIKILREK